MGPVQPSWIFAECGQALNTEVVYTHVKGDGQAKNSITVILVNW